MKKKVISILLASALVVMSACGFGNEGASNQGTEPSTSSSQGSDTGIASNEGTTSNAGNEAAATGELVDGKFAETRHITV